MIHSHARPNSRRAVVDWSTRVLIVVWLLAIAGGWFYIERHEFATSDAAAARTVERWPSDSNLRNDRDRPALVLFLHPKCPCSRATLAELDRLLASNRQPNAKAIQLIVVVTVPLNAGESWWDTATLAKTRSLPGAQVFIDRDGYEAARFGATTSGMVMFFDAVGARRYAGGITITRGHEGRSAGGDVVEALVRGEPTESLSLPVFGCRLCLPGVEADRDIVGRAQERRRNLTPAVPAI